MKNKLFEIVIVGALVFLQGCLAFPGPQVIQIGTTEIMPISMQATITGVHAVANGMQPLGQVFINSVGTRVVVWPGAAALEAHQ